MQKTSIYIISWAAAIGCISIIYCCTIAMHLPYIVCAALVAACLFFLFRWSGKIHTEDAGNSNIPLYILIAGVIVFTNETFYAATKHGAWDAWAIWDLHARYLLDDKHWRNMFLNSDHAHPDYPLALPATLAFFYKPFATQLHYVIAFAFHYTIMLCIPVLIFLQTYKRGLILSGAVFLYFTTNAFYIMQGTYLMADTLLAFFLLCAVIAIDHYGKDKRIIALCTFMLGCCCCTKNEGLVLCLLFLAFYAKVLFAKQHIKYTIAGIFMPIAILALFKLVYAPANDIITANNQGIIHKLLDAERYKLTWTAFKNSATEYFYLPICGVALCILLSLIRKKPLPRALAMLLTCALAYFMVYIITPLDLQWHLSTSIDRVLHQLMPAIMYVLLIYFTGGNLFNFRTRFVSGRSSPL